MAKMNEHHEKKIKLQKVDSVGKKEETKMIVREI